MSIDLSQFIPTFLDESFEGLALMETSLLNLAQGDDETINAIFRAAHSIKGGAGTFGFSNITEFTHLVETLLDEMRDGRRKVTQSDIDILLESVDCIRLLIEAIRDESTCDDSKISATAELLELTLKSKSLVAEATQESSAPLVAENEQIRWLIAFVPEHHLVQTGNDPLLLLNALKDLGTTDVEASCQLIPSLIELDAKELYLSWQISIVTESSLEEIQEVFEWVEDECQLIITQEVANIDDKAERVNLADDVSEKEVAKGNIVTQKSVEKNTSGQVKNSSSQEKNTQRSKAESSSIRVGVDKVDSLINLVGELVITQSMLSELGNDFELSKIARLTSGLEQLLQNTKELQESVMRIRMMPISFAFNRFPRLIHDLSKTTGKEVELVINGEQTELDKTVMEQIGDPLVHLVRNAVDHGIEPADIRVAKGKPEKGTVALNAYHQGGSIVIEINDDGGGINRKAVFEKAVEKGLVEANSTLTDIQVFDLLFEPGFSTAKEVSDISGRGVGMDVVKRNIQSLGGRIQVTSEPDKGSTFKVYLPLTLAILDGQLVRVGSETYIIPLITIVESLQTKKELINRVTGNVVLYRLREDNVPVVPIYQLFNLAAEKKEIDNSLLVVVEADGQKVGLMVDDLLAQQQVVIKSLEENYQYVDGISGATILGDGSVAMILDVPGLIRLAMKKSQSEHLQMSHSVTQEVCA